MVRDVRRRRFDRRGAVTKRLQIAALRVGRIFESGAAAGIRLAGKQRLREALRTAERVGVLEEFQDGLRPQFEGAMDDAVIARHDDAEFAIFRRQAQPVRQRFDECDAALLVAAMARPLFRRCRSLAQIVDQSREPHARVVAQQGGLVEHHQGVHAGIDFRVPLRRLRHTEQCVDLGIDALQGAAFAQHPEELAGAALPQCLFGLLPHPFGYQCIDFATFHHVAHQRQRLRRHAKPERCEAGGEAGDAQHAHRIFGEGRRDVAKRPRLEVMPAAVRIDQAAIGRLRNGVDGQVAAGQILFEGDLGPELDRESAVAGRRLAFEPRQCVFLVRVGMQKYGKVASDFTVLEAQQLLARAADDDPIAFLDGKAEQGVPNSSANQIHLHG